MFNLHAEYVALSRSMRDLVPMKKLDIEVVKAVVHDTKRLYFSTHSTVFEDKYGVLRVTQNHKLPILNP